jgi:hypothetical protein
VSFLDRLQHSILQLADYLPALGGALIILFVGGLVARLVGRGTDRLLARLGVNRWLQRGTAVNAATTAAWRRPPSRIAGNIVFWLLMFSVILLAANWLGLESLENVFRELVGYIPSVIAAVAIILLGIILGEFVDGLILASAGSVHGGVTLARVGRGGVILLAVFMALQELGVGTEIVTTAFAIIFGALALAFALSFGLGNRELAGEITREWYARLRKERQEFEAATAEREAAEQKEREREEGVRLD